MPGGDRTGPAGMGSMTGRAAGYCAGYGAPGFANSVSGRGFGWGLGRGGGFGRGGGRGRRNWFYATGLPGWQRGAYGYPAYGGGMPYNMPYSAAPNMPPYTAGFSKEDELNALKGQVEYFEDALEGVKNRMAELEEESKGE
ncbi:MAG: DUF5320 domain-containing protein [Deltaproteobacteria bacterium]|nr:DUF5320 domain-containing protein [Deltaproteobacteria bacterium]MBW2650526.1 DUF5320 domain-containing protein [Deltaproteobacteria bacterium]